MLKKYFDSIKKYDDPRDGASFYEELNKPVSLGEFLDFLLLASATITGTLILWYAFC